MSVLPAKKWDLEEKVLEFGNAENAERNLQEERSGLLLDEVHKMYRCMNCGKKITQEDLKKRTRCPFCGYRILIKNRPEIVNKVKAR